MPAVELLFTQAEYDARLFATRAVMADQGLDALIVTDPSNMNWLTGYDGWSFYVHQAVVVTSAGQPWVWTRTQDMAGAYQTCWVHDAQVLTYPEEHVQNPPHHPYQTLCRHLTDMGIGGGRIGAEFDNYYFSAKCLEVLRSDLPTASIIDATGLVNWRRAVKSDAEIALMRKAGLISAAIHQTIRDNIRIGIPKHELVAEAQRAATRGVNGIAGDYAAIQVIAPSGKEASASHITWNDRPMVAGEATYFEISGCHHRYHCPVSRTYFLGDPPLDIRRAEAAILTAIEDVLSAAKPGVTCEDVAQAVYDSFARAGFSKNNRTGYPIGLSYPPDWGERTMSLRPGDTTELKEGMCFHLMPGLWTPDWGVAITESFVVTTTGGSALADIPREIFTS
ncbi:MAG: M24 family metallopeptidase [Pikeienuella sp.]